LVKQFKLCPLGQGIVTHAPPQQVCPAPQTFVQVPQFWLRSLGTHLPLQQICPAKQRVPQPPQFWFSLTQWPLQQICPAKQRIPQLPQLLLLLLGSTHCAPQQSCVGKQATPQDPQHGTPGGQLVQVSPSKQQVLFIGAQIPVHPSLIGPQHFCPNRQGEGGGGGGGNPPPGPISITGRSPSAPNQCVLAALA
jgi:hypothetical protein